MGRGSGNGAARPTPARHVRPETPEQALTETLLLAAIAPETYVAELIEKADELVPQLDAETVEACWASAVERADLWYEQLGDTLVLAAHD